MQRLIATAVLLAAAGAAAAQTVVTFDDLRGQAPMQNGYGGVSDWTTGGWWYYDWDQPPYNPSSPPTRIYSTLSNNSFTFAEPVRLLGASFAGYGSDFGYPPVSWSLFYQGQQVHQSAPLDLNGTPTFLDAGYDGLVDRVVVNGTTQFFIMDDLTYIIPAPSAATLLVFSGLAALRRRR